MMIEIFIFALTVGISTSQFVYPDNHAQEQQLVESYTPGSGQFSSQDFTDFQQQSFQTLGGRNQFGGGLGGASSDIHKHIFAYVAPDDVSDQVIRVPGLPKAGVHYKILFIKAPGTPTPKLDIPAIGGGPDIRTLVYVLQPRPGQIQVPQIQQSPTQKPSAPQVFFIKYNPRSIGNRFGRDSPEENFEPEEQQ